MKFFSKTEIVAVLIIFLALVVISAPNFTVSARRARDQVRNDDLGSLVNALDAYQTDFSSFPLSTPDGKIVACKSPSDKVQIDKSGRIQVNLIPCQWGKDPFIDLTPGSNKTYEAILQQDPQAGSGASYVYFSDGVGYQLLTSLEGSDEPEYDKTIVARKVMCGSRICNAGRSYNVPLDKSIEEYRVYLRQLMDAQNAQNKKK